MVTLLQLYFDDGTTSAPIRPGKDPLAVSTALRSMVAESAGRFRHVVRFRMADGSLVTAKPRVC